MTSQLNSSLSVEVSHCENAHEFELNVHEILENPSPVNEHDTILSPIDKIDFEGMNLSANDSTSTATNSSTNSQTQQQVPKRKTFNFDVKKVFSFAQPKEKSVPIKENKSNEEISPNVEEKKNKTEEKKLKSDEKKKPEDKKPKPEPTKSMFLLFGQVVIDSYLEKAEKPQQDFLVENNVKEAQPVLTEADPQLFAIEDDTIAQNSVIPEPAPKTVENKENKGTPKKGKTYKTVPFKGLALYKAEKDNKKPGLANILFKSKLTRYVGFENGKIFVGEKVKDDLKIKSEVPLLKLFQISIERENPKKLIMLFNNKKVEDAFNIPLKKCYKFENMQSFMNCLKEEVEKLGAELKLTHSQDFKL